MSEAKKKEMYPELVFGVQFNFQKFQPNNFLPEKPVVTESFETILFYPGQSKKVFLRQDTVLSDDDMWNPYAETEQFDFVSFEKQDIAPSLFLEQKVLMSCFIFLTKHKTTISRQSYTFLTFIGDVGALQGTLTLIFGSVLVNVLRIDILLENDLISSVFRKRKVGDGFGVQKFALTYMQWLRSYIGGLCLLVVCRCCGYCSKSRQEMIRAVGSRRIERELDITRFIRNQYILRAIIRSKTSKKERALARRTYRLIVDCSSEKDSTESSSTTDDNISFEREEIEREFPVLYSELRKRKAPKLIEAKLSATSSLSFPDMTQIEIIPQASPPKIQMKDFRKSIKPHNVPIKSTLRSRSLKKT